MILIELAEVCRALAFTAFIYVYIKFPALPDAFMFVALSARVELSIELSLGDATTCNFADTFRCFLSPATLPDGDSSFSPPLLRHAHCLTSPTESMPRFRKTQAYPRRSFHAT